MPVLDERGLFERMSLEAFQSGLSWRTILKKRDAFRAAFAGFDPELVARFGDGDVARLLGDAAIVRNRAKIEATLANARATVALRATEPLEELDQSARAHASGSAVRHVGGGAIEDTGDRRPCPRAQAARISLRRRDDALRVDAGLWPGRRPPCRLPRASWRRARTQRRRARLTHLAAPA